MSSTETLSLTRPYVGPSPIEDSRLFFGREREKVELANLLIGRRIVLLHSPSGAGKTSLIQAGLAPEIKSQGFLVMPVIRVSRQLEAGQNRRQDFNQRVSCQHLDLARRKLAGELANPAGGIVRSPLRGIPSNLSPKARRPERTPTPAAHPVDFRPVRGDPDARPGGPPGTAGIFWRVDGGPVRHPAIGSWSPCGRIISPGWSLI